MKTHAKPLFSAVLAADSTRPPGAAPIAPAPVAPAPVAPAPRTPIDGPAPTARPARTPRPAAWPAPTARPDAVRPGPGELDAILADLVEVVVWPSPDGCWQEHASFLLGTDDGQWHEVAFADLVAKELVTRLRKLPGFDARRLLELIGGPERRMVTLWRRQC